MEQTPQSEEQFSDIDRVPLSVMEHMSAYWKRVADRKKRQHDVSIRRVILGQLITILVVGVSSFLIEQREEAFLLFGATLLLYPALTDLLMSSGAVLSASVHHDLERQDESPFRFSLFATARSIVGTTLASIIVGSVAGIISWYALQIDFLSTMRLAVVATAIAASISLPIVLFVTHIARIKSNPDDVIPAFESSVFNVVMLLSIALAARIIS